MNTGAESVNSVFTGAERRLGGRPTALRKKNSLLFESPPQLSPRRLIPLMVCSVFLADVGIMLLLALIPHIPDYLEPLLDAGALLLVLSPTFYFFYYNPLVSQYRDRKEMIKQLYLGEERLALALDAVEDGLWDWNLPSGDMYASEQASRMLGYEPGDLDARAEPWGELVHPEEREMADRLLKEHLNGDSDHYVAEFRMRKKGGGYLWVLARGQVVARSGDGWPLRMVGTFKDISLRKEAEDALRRSEEDIRRLSRKLMLNSEEDKRHLAQDLHDEFGQVLCAFQMGVEMLRDNSGGSPEQHSAQCERLLLLVNRLEVDLRHMCDHLRPVMLEDLGLVAALKWHLDQFGKQNPGVNFEFYCNSEDLCLAYDQEIALYRICQETLNNIGKHAEASLVVMNLQRDREGLAFSISDNGHGFKEDEIIRRRDGWGLGLLGMRERAAVVGAELVLSSVPGQGTEVKIFLPLPGVIDDEVSEDQLEDVSA